ncbi:flavin reductase [Acrocarpospora catenulata]|uniref:flavin reductase n=1 Tax=Acrocarpospora catenulata TaxID=2836182 RepID=UPI001BD926A7|nr:flavin reductase [Acrocarpospora catenulata]
MTIDGPAYRRALGRHPTGVALVTALDAAGDPVGMIVGTFSSVSLDPPLVSFMPDRSSTSFPKIREAARFAVNVLSSEQAEVCRSFAARHPDRWDRIAWRPTPGGAPSLPDALLWVECEPHAIHEAGDHYIVIGRVTALGEGIDAPPLVFFRGGYGQFTPASLVLAPEIDLLPQIRLADLARAEMEQIAQRTGLECVAQALLGDELVFIASAGVSPHGHAPTRVGLRIPLIPPRGGLFAAWQPPEHVRWSRRFRHVGETPAGWSRMLHRIRERGWSIWLADDSAELDRLFDAASGGEITTDLVERVSQAIDKLAASVEPADLDPGERCAVRFLGAPVFGTDGRVQLALRLLGLPPEMSWAHMRDLAAQLVAGADRVTRLLGVDPDACRARDAVSA